MAEHVIKMPDVGEGVAEAEIVEWHVRPGDPVREDMVLAAVMTDKATVEIPSPVAGIVAWLAGEVGDVIAVRAPLVRISLDGAAAEPIEPSQDKADQGAVPAVEAETPRRMTVPAQPVGMETGQRSDQAVSLEPTRSERLVAPAAVTAPKPLASPAVRQRALQAGIDLRQVRGSGPAGRIMHEDLDIHHASSTQAVVSRRQDLRRTDTETVKMTGLRRKIAEKMALSVSRIPHITYVEEVDVTDLEALRSTMNAGRRDGQPKLTILPFLIRALVRTLGEQPALNATFDDDKGIITRHGAVHVGIATQTPAGLTVPVLRHAEARTIWDCASELARVSDAARKGSAQREELSGSTITITSLGSLGGIVTTPVINHPEVAIVGVNKIVTRPGWDGAQFVPRKMMNLSSSFDHRVIDGWDAAVFIQRIRVLLETPALIFVEG